MINLSDLLAIAASACFALGAMVSSTPAKIVGAPAFVRWRFTLITIGIWIIYLIFFGLPQWQLKPYLILAISGISGIFIGDSFLFLSMNAIGPRRSGIIFNTHAIFSVIFSFIFLNERFGAMVYIGALITILGVMIAIGILQIVGITWGEKKAVAQTNVEINNQAVKYGEGAKVSAKPFLFAIFAAICHSLGVIIAKPVMSGELTDMVININPLLATAIRVSSAAICFWLLRLIIPKFTKPIVSLNFKLYLRMFMSGLIGMGLGMSLLFTALENGSATTIGVLSSLSPIFILPMLWLKIKKAPTINAWIGAIIAVLGVSLIISR